MDEKKFDALTPSFIIRRGEVRVIDVDNYEDIPDLREIVWFGDQRYEVVGIDLPSNVRIDGKLRAGVHIRKVE